MEKVKILDLLIYSKQRKLGLSLSDLYSLVFQGLVRYRHKKFLCLSEQSLINFIRTQGLSLEVKEKAQQWLSVLLKYQGDNRVKREKKRQRREILKMRIFFKKLQSKQGVKSEPFTQISRAI